MEIFWFLPTHGDQRYLGTSIGARPATFSYLKQIAQSADRLGYKGILVPSGRSCEDPWVVTSALINETKQLKFLVAMRPGFVSPTVSARMTSTLDRISGGHGREGRARLPHDWSVRGGVVCTLTRAYVPSEAGSSARPAMNSTSVRNAR